MAKSSFVERNRAVRVAWIKEQELIQEGKGTREWTPEQQKDILEKGRAYDDSGKAFEGQHMKSAEKYPEYQGEPGNIQFLTRTEHLKAHDGNWQNPTNWYYNPVTEEKIDFGDGPFIPCQIIQLPEPVVYIVGSDTSSQEQNIKVESFSEKLKDTSIQNIKIDNQTHKNPEILTPPKVQTARKANNIFFRSLKSMGRFIVEHPIESFEIARVVIGGTVKIIFSMRGRGSGGLHGTTLHTSSSSANISSITGKVTNIVEKANSALPSGNDVTGHKQRYHTKNGIIWKDKAPYHRGRKNNK